MGKELLGEFVLVAITPEERSRVMALIRKESSRQGVQHIDYAGALGL